MPSLFTPSWIKTLALPNRFIRSYLLAERLVAEGYTDYISLSRPLIREPRLIARWQSGDLRKATCVSCNGCLGAARSGQGIYCILDRKDPE